MSKSGPIIVIEDDPDDRDILNEVFEDLGIKNKLVWFSHGEEAFQYMLQEAEQPFMILCDVNLPRMTGVELKKKIDGNDALRQKSIPFVFYSTSVDKRTVNEAYTKMSVQGFFQKSHSYEEVKKNIQLIYEYWRTCKHPNN